MALSLMQVGPAEGSLERIRQMDAELFRLARGAGGLRLHIGQAWARMGEGYRDLGFSTLGGYALERCSRRARWALESRALARRLEELPLLRTALASGSVGWSMAELLARHATPQEEAALLEEAKTKTVRAMRESLQHKRQREANGIGGATDPESADSLANRKRDANDNAVADDEAEPRRRTLTLSVPVEEAYMLDAVRRIVEHIDGRRSAGDWFEALVAEGQDAFMDYVPPGDELLPQDVVDRHAAWLARVKEAEQMRRRNEARAEAHLPRQAWSFDALDGQPDDDPLPQDLVALDERVRRWSQELSSRDLWFGKLVERFFEQHGWRALGYASETQYARERLGMSRSAMRSKLALARNTRWLQQTAKALQQGGIGVEAAALVARVASVDTEAAWLERARRRTFKHLREEVEAAEWVARLSPGTHVGELAPPTAEELGWVQDAEREILSGEMLRRAALDETEARQSGSSLTGADPTDTAVQISGAHGEGHSHDPGHGAYTSVTVRVDEETALWFRQLEEAFRRRAPGQSFIRFMCMAFFRAWAHTLGKSDKWEAIYRRDLYRCTNPVCDRRSVTPHHVRYRSAGGGHEPGNVTSPCECCHLEGEHGGRLKIRGRAPELTWTLGRTPIMKIEGRERVLLANTFSSGAASTASPHPFCA